jgi:hypothetical protein
VSQLPRRIVIAQAVALFAVLVLVIPAEVEHLQDAAKRQWSDWFIGVNVDTTPALLLFVVLPFFWLVRRPLWSFSGGWWERLTVWWVSSVETPPSIRAIVLVATTSLTMCAHVGSIQVGDREQYRFGNLPPAFHDEFSYLVQAETYLAGRVSFEGHPTAARLFDQMHVVNEGRFASRYFPATGLFVAPWLWLGFPLLGHWLAGAATCVFVFFIGRELANNGTGFVASLLTALSPGMALFGNLVLAHHPTLLGLFFFAWLFLRWLRTGSHCDAFLAGLGLSWAMLCRPMTAAGFALPFGIVFVAKLWLQRTRSANEGECSTTPPVARPRWRFGLVWRPLLAMALPLVIGFGVLAIHNRAITGSVMVSPYQLFNDVYTPRHVYGFNNVVRGEQHLGPRVLDHYDRWAENLTPALAVENTKNRLLASWQWTVGLVPLLAASLIFLATGSTRDRRWWLIYGAIVSLFIAHVPYWFVGMFHWHYVFETGPLWCLLLAAVTDKLCCWWLADERPWMPIWWSLLMASAVAVNLTDLLPFWYPSKLQAVVEQVAFSRLKYQAFDELLRHDVRRRPALVLIEADPADRHIDYVVNEPSLSADVLRGRYPVPDWPLERIVAEFPRRSVYLFRAKTGDLRLISRAKESVDAK